MTLPWSKLPRSLAGDPRFTLLSPEGSCAYLAARVLADDRGALWCVGDRDAVGTLAAIIAPKRGGDPAWARAAVEECVEAPLLEVGNDGASLRVIDWLDAPDTAPSPVAAVDRRGTPARRPGRPAKGAAPMPPRERKVRFLFEKRLLVAFREVGPEVTWEAWAAQHPDEAAELLRPKNETRERNPSGGNETKGTGTKPGNETRERNSAGGRAVSGTSGSSETQRDGETRGKSESPDARGGERNPGTKLGNETHAAGTKPSVVSCTDAEHATPFAADEVLSRMSIASGQRIAALGSTTHVGAFAALARDLMARGQVDVPRLVQAGAHAAHVPWIQRLTKPLTVERLTVDGGKTLVELLTGAAACAACGGAPLAAADARHPDDDAVETARRRYRAAPVTPGEAR